MAMGAIIFGSVGLLFIALGVPLMLRRVKPNVWYGLRSRDTLTDERLWFDANARLGRDQILLGVGLLVLAWALPWWLGISEEIYLTLCTAWVLLGTLTMCLVNWRRARRAKGAG